MTHFEKLRNELENAGLGEFRNWSVLSLAALRLKDKCLSENIYALHGGGELAFDAAVEAAVNGWKRDEKGNLPSFHMTYDKCIGKDGKLWFQQDAPDSKDLYTKDLVEEVRKIREEEAAKVERERNMRKLQKSRRNNGFKKMWCKIEGGMLGSVTVEIVCEGKVITVEGAIVSPSNEEVT